MSVIVLVNIGTQDVQRKGIIFHSNEVRARGKEILDNYTDLKQELFFPILQPPLEKILSEVAMINRLVLFGTDQDDPHYNQKDTIYFAKIVEKFINTKYSEKINELEIVRIRHINPSLYDEAMNFFREALSGLSVSKKETTQIYILPTAGIPACSMALLLQGLMLFGEQCQVLYQHSIKEQHPLVVPIGAQMQAAFQRQTAVYLLQQFNFFAAQQIIQTAHIDSLVVTHLLRYATARLRFEFREANNHLKQAIAQTSGNTRIMLAQIEPTLAALIDQEPKAIVGELLHNARIAWENGRRLDFLARLHRFQQIALAMVINIMPPDLLPYPNVADTLNEATQHVILLAIIQKVKEKSEQMVTLLPSQRKNLLKQMKAHYNLDEIQTLCFELGIDYGNVGSQKKPNVITDLIQYCERHHLLLTLIQKVKQDRKQAAWEHLGTLVPYDGLTQCVFALERLENLCTLYQKSILANGFDGITEAIITSPQPSLVLESRTTPAKILPLQDMILICTTLNISTQNPFLQIRDIIIDSLL